MEKDIAEEIELLIDARYPIIYMVTWEEDRVIEQIEEIARRMDLGNVYSWTLSQGLKNLSNERDHAFEYAPVDADPVRALDVVLNERQDGIFIFQDLHPFLTDSQWVRDRGVVPMLTRKLRDIATAFRYSASKTLILLSPVLSIPADLEKDITVLDFPLPDQKDLNSILEGIQKNYNTQLKLGEHEKEDLFRAALGLTANEAYNVFQKARRSDNIIAEQHVQFILDEKEQIIRKSGILEYYPPLGEFDSIGGLDALKAWLAKRAKSFTQLARDFGLPEPKGILLLGVPGCGKSLCAKVVASEWNKPLLRLDLGRIFGGLVGASEDNMRRALKVAEGVSPCILWIDEIEKGLAGIQGTGDSGVTARVFGTLLTWMQEKTSPVFVISTANDISQLPPELLRKGRFDEIFFVDLPMDFEREEIFRIHVEKRVSITNKLSLEGIDLKRLAQKTEGFSGAEIEQVIISSLYDAYNIADVDHEAELDYNRIILENIEQTVPLSRAMKPVVQALRKWAKTRARFASSQVAELVDQATDEAKSFPQLQTAFLFRDSGNRARTLETLIKLCDEYPEEARGYLYDGDFEKWFTDNGQKELARKASEIAAEENRDIGLLKFIEVVREAASSQEAN